MTKENGIGINVTIAKDTVLGKDVVIGNNVTIYPRVTIGDGTRIFDGSVIGRPPISTGNTTRPVDSSYRPLYIGERCVVGANSVIYTDVKIGDRVLVGDGARIREGCEFSDDAVIGGGVLVMYETTVGKRSRVIDGSILTGNMIIENDVFIGPGVVTINDNEVYLSRFGLEPLKHQGPIVRRFALIGAGANLSAEIEIGEGAIVAPNAMVTKNVPEWTVVAGIPARYLRDVGFEERVLILDKFGFGHLAKKGN